MKKILLYLLFVTQVVVAQQNITHTVVKGETVYQIAKKYSVTPESIFLLNPDAKLGIVENIVLVISKAKNIEVLATKHLVKEKETLFSISKMFQIDIEALIAANPETKTSELKIGQILIIPIDQSGIVFHEILPKETKYSIAKMYDTTIENLEKLNPEIVIDFPVGKKIKVKESKKQTIQSPKLQLTENSSLAIKTHTIEAKETLYSISNLYKISIESLVFINPELKNGLQIGQIIKIPNTSNTLITKKDFKNLGLSLQKKYAKKLAILLPFNLNKLEKDTINSTQSRLKKDKFLNLTLDFYSGALMAIDSVKKLGLPISIDILDSNETKSTSNISNTSFTNNLQEMNAVIGPFYQNNVEKLAEILAPNAIPVISPLSKDFEKSYTNLYQFTPTQLQTKQAMMQYLQTKQANILAIIDPKKAGTKQFLTEKYSEVAIIDFNEKGVLNVEQLKLKLVTGKTNYVILDTEKTNLILSSTSVLVSQLANFDIQLVVLDENEAFDYEEIPMNRLTKLRLIYPSITRVNTTKEAVNFENAFRKKNKMLPNQYAIRGFDITFDTILRMFQEKPFEEITQKTVSEQVESKFDYEVNELGGFYNKGIYILQYNSDLTITEAK